MTSRSDSSASKVAEDPEKISIAGDFEVVVPCSDGDSQAWSALAGIWLIQFCAFGYINAFGVYNDYYVRIYLTNSSPSKIGWIGSVQLFLVAFSGVLTGKAHDAGYVRHMLVGGSLLLVFSLFMLSLTHPGHYYQVFFSQGLGVGLAAGLCDIPTLALISQFFRRKRALAMGIAASANAIGGALHSIMLNQFFHGRVGFSDGIRISAGLCGGLLFISQFLIRPRGPPIKRSFDILRTMRTLATDLPFLLVTLGTTFVAAGLFFPIFFIQLNAIKNGISPHFAFYTITILNVAGAFGRILPALFVPRFGVFNVMIICLWITVVLIFCTLAVKDVAGTVVYAIMYGFFSGAYAGLSAPVTAATAKDDSNIGANIGVCCAVASSGCLFGTPLAAALLTSAFIWWRGILFSGLCIFSASMCFLGARCLYAKQRGTAWL